MVTPQPRQAERNRMVQDHILARGVRDPHVIQAMRVVPRHRFVPEESIDQAYEDHPLPIGYDQTISQPFIVAFMTEALKLQPHERVLEIGTGSGYQAAILSQLVEKVFSLEIVEPLALQAKETLQGLHIDNVEIRTGDGHRGWPEEAPFDAIILTAAPEEIPQPLLDQLAMGGRFMAPLGGRAQQLIKMTRIQEGWQREELLPVVFVPMTGATHTATMSSR